MNGDLQSYASRFANLKEKLSGLHNFTPPTEKSYEIAEKRCIETLLNCFYRETLESGKYIRILGTQELESLYAGVPKSLISHSGLFMHINLSLIDVAIIVAIKRPSKLGFCHIRSVPYLRESSDWKELNWQELMFFLLKELSENEGRTLNIELVDQINNSYHVMAAAINAKIHEDEKSIVDSSYIESEQALLFGHSFHPAPKSREGFIPEDIHEFSPELSAQFQLHYFLVKKEYVWSESVLDKSALDIIQENISLDLAREGYLLVCTHPWQARYLKQLPIVKRALDEGILYDLGKQGQTYHATSSIRTVYNSESKYFYKFSLNVRITNCVRKNAVYELKSAVLLTKLLLTKEAEILNKFPDFHLLLEPASVSVNLPNGSVEEQLAATEGFGIIFRENFTDDQLKEVKPFLAGSLFSKTLGGDSDSHISNVIKALSDSLKSDYASVAKQWFNKYVEKLVFPILYCHFNLGLTFEPHLQNVLIGIDNECMPTQIFIRDLEGTKLNSSIWPLEKNIDEDEKVKQSIYYSDQQAWDRITYCLLVNNIGEAIFHLSGEDENLENKLWSCVKEQLNIFKECYGNNQAEQRIGGLLSDDPLPIKGNFMTRFLKKADKQAVYYYLTDHPLKS